MTIATPPRREWTCRNPMIFMVVFPFDSVVEHDGRFERDGGDLIAGGGLLDGEAQGQEVADPVDVEPGLVDDSVAVVVEPVGQLARCELGDARTQDDRPGGGRPEAASE